MLYDPKYDQKKVVTLEPWQRLLLDAADLIERHGLAKYNFSEPNPDGTTRYCVAGAIMKAEGSIPYSILSMGLGGETACRKFLDYVGGDSVSKWNDTPNRTQEEVVAALRTAASL